MALKVISLGYCIKKHAGTMQIWHCIIETAFLLSCSIWYMAALSSWPVGLSMLYAGSRPSDMSCQTWPYQLFTCVTLSAVTAQHMAGSQTRSTCSHLTSTSYIESSRSHLYRSCPPVSWIWVASSWLAGSPYNNLYYVHIKYSVSLSLFILWLPRLCLLKIDHPGLQKIQYRPTKFSK
jgi:hypothetical protein